MCRCSTKIVNPKFENIDELGMYRHLFMSVSAPIHGTYKTLQLLIMNYDLITWPVPEPTRIY